MFPNIFNEIAKTGLFPKEIQIGILNPLPKPKKIPEPRINLRPIILLSIIRKILTICLIRRTWSKFEKRIFIRIFFSKIKAFAVAWKKI